MGDNSTEILSCMEHILNITKGLRPHEVLANAGPGGDTRIWTELTRAWRDAFTAAAVILGLVYFTIGAISTALLVKKGSPRLQIRTFFAVYLSISIMGFSRALLYWLDPFGMMGFLGSKFSGWIVISRYLAVLGFPSLIASCTMIVFTLLKIMDVKRGKKWYEYWRYVILITVSPYVVAILAESLGYISTYTALIMGLICEAFFVLWGLSVCITYLTAGLSLLRKLEKSNREMTEILETDIMNNQPNDLMRKQSKVYRKIFMITIGTATTGVLYTVLTAVNTILAFLFIFHQCMGFMNRRGNSTVWLFLHVAIRVIETVLAFFILYSVTDMSTVTSCLKRLRNCRKNSSEEQRRGKDKMTSHCSESCSQQVEAEATCLANDLSSSAGKQPQQYKLHTQEPPASTAVTVITSQDEVTSEELNSPSHISQSST